MRSLFTLFCAEAVIFSMAYADFSVTPMENFLCSGYEGGPFSPSQKIYAVTNSGSEAITWGVSESAGWIECTPEWGLLDPNTSVNVTVSLTTAAESLTAGEYIENITFSDVTNTIDIVRQAILTVGTASTGPVAWWKLEGDATDSSGNGHHGTVYGDPNWIIEGKVDGAIELEGIDDFVSVPNHDDFRSGFPFSISLWMKADNPASDSFIIQLSPPDDDTYYSGASILFTNDLSGKIYAGYSNGGPPNWTSRHAKISTTSLQPGQWYHVAAVMKGYRNIDLYINGISEGNYDDGTATTIAYTNENLSIGSRKNGINRFFDGMLDDIRIYDRALSQAEIVEIAGIGPLVVSPIESFDILGEPGGPFTPAYKDYTLKNLGTESLYWGIDALPSWIDVDSSFGLLDPNESTTVRVFLTPDADSLEEGLYTTAVTINNLSITQDPVIRDVNLDIQKIYGIWAAPESFTLTLTEGTEYLDVLTVGNDGTETINFSIRSRTVVLSSSELTLSSPASTPSEVPEKVIFDVQQALIHEHKPERVLVRFAPNQQMQYPTIEIKQQMVSDTFSDAIVTKQYKTVPGLSLIQLPEGITIEEALESFNQRQDVLYVQPDYRVYMDSVIPNDLRFNELWGLHNTGQSGGLIDADIDAPESWDISTGSDTVIVAVIDTGVDYNHQDLAANMWINQTEYDGSAGVDDDGNGYVDDIYGYDFANNDGNPMDDHYHGTHCAGTIGAVGNNGIGVTGVCWNVKIMAVKFLDSGGDGWTSDAIESVEYATLMGAHITSNSWGGGSYDQGLKDVIDAAGANGILFVAAADNDSVNNDIYPHYPSSYTSDNIIAVLATDRNDNMSSFSNWGPTSVDIGAPGSSILSCEPGNQYQYLNGTSMATPHVSGACALLRSINPSLGVSEIKDIILNSSDVISSLAGKCVSQGRLNVNNAVLETTVPWIEFDIEQGSLDPVQSISVNVTFNATELAPGDYHAEVLIISDDLAHPLLIIPVELTVLPDPLEVTPETGFDPNGLEGGPFVPDAAIYTLSNTGSTALDWSVQWEAGWLTVDPTAGTLDPDQSFEVLVSLEPNAVTMLPGLYEDDLIFNNLTVASTQKREVQLSIHPPDKFTQVFDSTTEGLQNTSITFRPDDAVSYYAACVGKDPVSSFPVDPNGGTYVTLGDDDYVQAIFAGGKQFNFYGTVYDRVYIGSNGYLTFGQDDVEYDPTLEYHFSVPRISAFFTDLTPTDNQSVSYLQTGEKFVVTYQDVPIFGDKTATNSFQIELFFSDGSLRLTYLNLDTNAVVVGLSQGLGIPGFFEESNLLSYLNCCDCGDIDGDGLVGLNDVGVLAFAWLRADCVDLDWCERTDFNRNGQVDLTDMTMLSQNWQKIDYAWSEPEFLLELNGKAWSEPQHLSELDDDLGNKAEHPRLTRGGLTIYFSRYIPALGAKCIVQATRTSLDESFVEERILTELASGGNRVGSPWISEDEQRLYYHEKVTEEILKMATWNESSQQWIPDVRTFSELHYGPGYGEALATLTSDELNVFWLSTRPDGTGALDLWTASRLSIDDPFVNIRELTELNTENNDGGPCISPDGLTLFFNCMYRAGGDETTAGIYKATRLSLSDPFGNVELIAIPGYETMWECQPYMDFERNNLYFSTSAGGIYTTFFGPDPAEEPAGHPYLTADGLTIYYNRNVPELGQKCIFKAARSSTDEPFSNEEMLSELIQTGGNLGSPWLSTDGQRLYYHESHPSTNEALMKMAVWSEIDGQWHYERSLDEIHYGPDTVSILASLTEDELQIFWCSTRSDGTGPWDIWTASRSDPNELFENVHEVEGINTVYSDHSPSISPEGLTLYFNSVRDDGSTQQIYRATRSSCEDSFGDIEMIHIPGSDSLNKLHVFVTRDGKAILFEASIEEYKGCYMTEYLPAIIPCLPK